MPDVRDRPSALSVGPRAPCRLAWRRFAWRWLAWVGAALVAAGAVALPRSANAEVAEPSIGDGKLRLASAGVLEVFYSLSRVHAEF
jgi:hypothetical protein